MSAHPEILWAQRSSADDESKNIIYLTVNLPEINESTFKLDLKPKEITFEAKAGRPDERDYKFSITLFDEIDPDIVSKKLTTRSLVLVLRKKEKSSTFWQRLTEQKQPFVKTDFEKWVDEDEQDGDEKLDEEGFDGMPGMGGMGGMGDMGGMGGMPGMGGMGDFSSMMGGGMPGVGGGIGGMDFEKMMAEMKANKDGSGPDGIDPADSDSDDEGPPPLEEAEEDVKEEETKA